MAATWGWTARDLAEHGVGGTETAMGNMARAFARLGHQVAIFHPTPRPCELWGVSFRHVGDLAYDEPWDVFISLSHVPGLARVRAEVKVHWCLEHVTLWVKDWGEVLPAVDAVFTISPYHTALLVHKFGLPADRLHTTSCAVDPEEYRDPLPKVPGQLMYCSVPDRGLHHLPAIYRMVRQRVRDLGLVVTGDLTLWGLPSAAGWARQLFADLPGVRFLGRVPRPQLVELQKRSVLHVYPCIFQELFCLASLECQAAGALTVTSDLGALPTTVEDGVGGFIVPTGGGPRPDFDRPVIDAFTPATYGAFADRIVELLSHPGLLQAMRRRARERALRRFGADVVAREWLEVFGRVVGRRAVG
jgi:glycosyltransferase involved in cell wall biosynthesis